MDFGYSGRGRGVLFVYGHAFNLYSDTLEIKEVDIAKFGRARYDLLVSRAALGKFRSRFQHCSSHFDGDKGPNDFTSTSNTKLMHSMCKSGSKSNKQRR